MVAKDVDTIIAKRAKWHLLMAILSGTIFIYPCLYGVTFNTSPLSFWLAKGFLFLFVTPVMLCCGYQLINQENAIVSENGGFRFATMLPWGRSTLQIADIVDCSYESIPEVCDHLILSVTPSCYAKESKSRTWSGRSNDELRFDLMYTSASPKETSTRLKRLLRKDRD